MPIKDKCRAVIDKGQVVISEQDKIVLVTGGTRGIGAAIVKRLVEDGYFVVYTGRTEASVKRTQSEFRKLLERKNPSGWPPRDLRTHGIVLDLTECMRAPDEAWTAFSKRLSHRCERRKIFALVNNAGTSTPTPLLRGAESDADILSQYAVNLIGPHLFTRRLVPRLCHDGTIVNIASQLGLVGRANMDAYTATKHGLVGLTRAWAAELAPHGIRVNAVCPGWVETEMIDEDLARTATREQTSKEGYRSRIVSRLNLGRFTQPHEVAAIVAFFLSPDASGITGQAYAMNGPMF